MRPQSREKQLELSVHWPGIVPASIVSDPMRIGRS